MDTKEIGRKLVELCESGHFFDAIDTLYADDIVSIEAAESPDFPLEMRGIEAIRQKNRQWGDAHEIHTIRGEGPWPHHDRFAVRWRLDITRKADAQRIQFDEIAIYTVAGGKIVTEEFYYDA